MNLSNKRNVTCEVRSLKIDYLFTMCQIHEKIRELRQISGNEDKIKILLNARIMKNNQYLES